MGPEETTMVTKTSFSQATQRKHMSPVMSSRAPDGNSINFLTKIDFNIHSELGIILKRLYLYPYFWFLNGTIIK